MEVCVCVEGGAVSADQRAFTHTPVQKQPPSAAEPQTPTPQMWLTLRPVETCSQDSWSKLGVFTCFQTRRASSSITWSTAVQRRRCRRRRRSWRHTSLSWRLRWDGRMTKVTRTGVWKVVRRNEKYFQVFKGSMFNQTCQLGWNGLSDDACFSTEHHHSCEHLQGHQEPPWILPHPRTHQGTKPVWSNWDSVSSFFFVCLIQATVKNLAVSLSMWLLWWTPNNRT